MSVTKQRMRLDVEDRQGYAWRCWCIRVTPDDGPVLISPCATLRTGHELDRVPHLRAFTQRGPVMTSEYCVYTLDASHTPPEEGCTCGLHCITAWASFGTWVSEERPWSDVCARVRVRGRSIPSTKPTHPPGTLRAESLEIAGPLILRSHRHAAWGSSLAARYGQPVVALPGGVVVGTPTTREHQQSV